jgi:ATP-dependent DNA helicase RecQ
VIIKVAEMNKSIDSILQSVFGYRDFRPLQRDIIERQMTGKDTLAILPTGGGKSICYQIPAILHSGLTIVVSPLISLMKDQIDQLEAIGVSAVALNSSLGSGIYQLGITKIVQGKSKLLYCAPESLFTPRIQELLQKVTVSALVIDEAHCISEWGHDFRPEYRRISEIRKTFPKAVCLALTATATPRVRADICRSLALKESETLVASFDRPNIYFSVKQKNQPKQQVLEFIANHRDESGIIYCLSRKGVDELSQFLNKQGLQTRAYHAGLSDQERRIVQELFLKDDVSIIVGTVAFGMGINKSNVRWVIHYDLPKSVEGYYQEVGRAGRDGVNSYGLLLYSYQDYLKLQNFLKPDNEYETAPSEHKPDPMHALKAIYRYAEKPECRRKQLVTYFGEAWSKQSCGTCDVCCEGGRDLIDMTLPARKFLSCIFRCGEKFGANHVIDVLMGVQTEKVASYKHEALSTWGIGANLTRKEWMHVARQLELNDLVARDPEYGVISLTPSAWAILKAKDSIRLADYPKPTKGNKAKSKIILIQGRQADSTKDVASGGLFEHLRVLRKKLADESAVPPYVIFSDKTLYSMVEIQPTTTDAFLEVYGVGATKASRYGALFMQAILEYRSR